MRSLDWFRLKIGICDSVELAQLETEFGAHVAASLYLRLMDMLAANENRLDWLDDRLVSTLLAKLKMRKRDRLEHFLSACSEVGVINKGAWNNGIITSDYIDEQFSNAKKKSEACRQAVQARWSQQSRSNDVATPQQSYSYDVAKVQLYNCYEKDDSGGNLLPPNKIAEAGLRAAGLL